MKKGWFISLEGIDGCGKSTLSEYLLKILKEDDIVGIREPGGTEVSEKIRDILLDVRSQGISAKTEALLYAAARSQLVDEVIKPALRSGKIVLADRYVDSTLAYQGYGRGLEIEWLKTLNLLSTGGVTPDLTLLLDIEPEEALRRRKQEIPDRLEKEGINFQHKVRKGYLKMAREEKQRIKVIDAAKEFQRVADQALEIIRGLLTKG